MSRKKLFAIIIICVILIAGVLLIKTGKKESSSTPTATSENVPPTSYIKDGSPDKMKEVTNENYKSGIFLEITSPKPGATVTSPTLTLKGKTSAKADVFINDTELKADSSGNFSSTITLEEGENVIVIVANDEEGNSAEEQLLVTRE